VLLVYLFRGVDLAELGRHLREARWGWVAVATAIAPLQIWVRGRRWWYLFPPGSNPPPLTPAMMIGYMANNVLPLRAGEVVRIYVVARRWTASGAPERIHPFWTTLATLVVERVLDSLVVVLVLALLVLIVPVPRFLEMAALVVLAIDVVGIAVLIALAAAPDACIRLVARLVGRWPGLHRRLLNIFETFVHGLDGIRAPSHAAPLVAWTVAVWLVPALAAWTMFRALDLHLPFIAGWAVLSFVGLGISIPSAPGYVGVFHAAAVLAVGLFGVSHSAGVGYALLFHASQILPVTLVGWLYFLREQVSLTEASRANPRRLS
jgi:glycosyltransferase 2 family protein